MIKIKMLETKRKQKRFHFLNIHTLNVFSTTADLRRISTSNIRIFGLALFLLGCQDRDVHVYRVPKEQPFLPLTSTHDVLKESNIRWVPPEHWIEQPLVGLRQGSFRVQGTSGYEGDVSIIGLKGDAGGVLANVNLWRQQLHLSPIAKSNLPAIISGINVGGEESVMVDLTSEKNIIKETHQGRIMASIIPQSDMTWFIKIAGETKLVEKEKSTYLSFLKTISFSEKTEPRIPQKEPTHIDGIQWTLPEMWEAQPVSGMRMASFTVQDIKKEVLDISVVSLPGSAGSTLANVNRWRGQIGLGPFDRDTLEKESKILDLPGKQIMMVDILNEDRQILAAILHHQGKTWFFKMTGHQTFVSPQNSTFIDFLKSLRFSDVP
ncbi:MAG: hypothetical protein GKR87_10075 [Kiritimatiellae bacterium]|nr:hypothetical protein [Kiritimatiellia bacterium]